MQLPVNHPSANDTKSTSKPGIDLHPYWGCRPPNYTCTPAKSKPPAGRDRRTWRFDAFKIGETPANETKILYEPAAKT